MTPSAAVRLFDMADRAARAGDSDLAIGLYLDGLKLDPTNIERGYEPLRQAALARLARGAKAKSSFLPHVGSRGPVDELIEAEHAVTLDPNGLIAMVRLLKSMEHAGLTAERPRVWICGLILGAQRSAAKKDVRTLLVVADALEASAARDPDNAADHLAKAIEACDLALGANPADPLWVKRKKDLETERTVAIANYARPAYQSVKPEATPQWSPPAAGDSGIDAAITRAREELARQPEERGKRLALAAALGRKEEDGADQQAIEVLEEGFAASGSYELKLCADDMRIHRLRRRIHQAEKTDPAAVAALQGELKQLELAAFTERARAYPTDMVILYNLGRCQFRAGLFNEAIVSLQKASGNLKVRAKALALLGQAFSAKGLKDLGIKSFRDALNGQPPEETRKEVLMHLARALQDKGDIPGAIEAISQIVQTDYGYAGGKAAELLEQLLQLKPA